MTKFEADEVRVFADALARASQETRKKLPAVVAKGALNIKKDAQRRISGLAHARAYPLSITYDLFQSVTGPAAEIGPDKNRRQGPLGNILEFGTVNNPPHPHIRPAAEAEEPRFQQAIEDLAVKGLEGR